MKNRFAVAAIIVAIVNAPATTAFAADPSFTCQLREGGKRMVIQGNNSSGQNISCSEVHCEAFINIPGGTRRCEIKTPFNIPPNTKGQEIGNCFDDTQPATRVIGTGFTC